jgi:hypothetical protein
MLTETDQAPQRDMEITRIPAKGPGFFMVTCWDG